MLTDEEVEYLESKLHSPEMQCRQCELVRRLIEEKK